MNRKGHIGMTLLAYAPVAYLLITDGKLVLAVLGGVGIQAVERLPDQDFHLPFLTHRGLSHSLVAVLVIGGILGAGGWLLGDRLFEWLYALFSIGGELWGRLLSRLPDLSTDILAGLMPNVPPEEIISTIKQQAGGSVDRLGFATFGFTVGAGGVLVHLLGDVITTQGINPFLPLSRWQLSLSPLRADSPTANSGLFFVGVAAVVVVLGATVPGVVLGAMAPADLSVSPIGVASAQDAGTGVGPLVVPNGSVAINETQSNRTRIVLDSVTLPQNGYIVAQTVTGSNVTNQSATKATVVGYTQFVRSGSYQDVVLQLNQSVPVGTTVSVTLHNDTDGDETLDVGTGKADGPYRTSDGSPIHDSISIEAAGRSRANASVAVGVSNQTSTQTQNTTNSSSSTNGSATVSASATVVFRNQITNGTNVTISSVTLPNGGFVVIHGPGYANQGIVSGSAITVSRYLSPGTHRNVTIQFSNGVPGAVSNISDFSGAYAPLSAVVYADTNGNHHYDYVESVGQNDTAYRRNGSRVADQARVVTQDQLDRKTQPTATVTLSNQSAADGTLTVARVRLPHGGWVIVHNQTYIAENDPLTSVVGRSKYLSAGVHRNVTVRLDQSLTRSQTVAAVAYRDTNGNKRYDYLRSGGVDDAAYVNRSSGNATLVTDRAHVSVPSPTVNTSPTHTSAPTTAGTSTTQAAPTTDRSPASGGVLSGLSVWVKGVLVVVAVGLGLTLIGRVT
jgi:membrane-bound metal-dependent hydrolase YbcI (DUF457 family)